VYRAAEFHACRHRWTERTLTCRSLAIAELASPRANLSAALSPNSSRNCCRSVVSPPLVDTACPGDTARATTRQLLSNHEFNLSNPWERISTCKWPHLVYNIATFSKVNAWA
jgi:hypothetical protein